MSRELYIEHANAIIWCRTTSDPFAATLYEITDADDGTLTKELLAAARSIIVDKRRGNEVEHRHINQLMRAPNIPYDTYYDLLGELNDNEDEHTSYDDALREIDFFADMVEELSYNHDREIDTKLSYTKSY